MADGTNYQGSHTCTHTHKVFKVIHGVTIPLNIASNMFCANLADAEFRGLN